MLNTLLSPTWLDNFLKFERIYLMSHNMGVQDSSLMETILVVQQHVKIVQIAVPAEVINPILLNVLTFYLNILENICIIFKLDLVLLP